MPAHVRRRSLRFPKIRAPRKSWPLAMTNDTFSGRAGFCCSIAWRERVFRSYKSVTLRNSLQHRHLRKLTPVVATGILRRSILRMEIVADALFPAHSERVDYHRHFWRGGAHSPQDRADGPALA